MRGPVYGHFLLAASVRAMLHALETWLPPPILLVVLAAVLWRLPGAVSSRVCISIGVPCLVLGLSINAWSKVMFRSARTTVNPLHPERSSALVTSAVSVFASPDVPGLCPGIAGLGHLPRAAAWLARSGAVYRLCHGFSDTARGTLPVGTLPGRLCGVPRSGASLALNPRHARRSMVRLTWRPAIRPVFLSTLDIGHGRVPPPLECRRALQTDVRRFAGAHVPAANGVRAAFRSDGRASVPGCLLKRFSVRSGRSCQEGPDIKKAPQAEPFL